MTETSPIFLDHQSTTPMDRRVLEKMLPYFTEHFGNAGSRTHIFGKTAARAVEEARLAVAELIGADGREILFTSGATEADNLAVKGVASFYRERGTHVVTSAVEHPAVLDSCRALEEQGFQITRVGVDRHGEVDPEEVARAITPETVLVSVMLANHEIGTVNDIAAIGRITRSRGILLHCDATQGVGKVPVRVNELGVDLLSLSAHKIYGPKGVGALYVRRRRPRVRLRPLLDGGGQERGFRSGTLNVPGIVGLGAACRLCANGMEAERTRLAGLRDQMLGRLRLEFPELRAHGHPERRLAGNLSVSLPGVDGNALLGELEDRVALSLGSACTSAVPQPSHVLKAIRVPRELLFSTFRFGFGRFNTGEEIDRAIDEVVEAVKKLRASERRIGRSSADSGCPLV